MNDLIQRFLTRALALSLLSVAFCACSDMAGNKKWQLSYENESEAKTATLSPSIELLNHAQHITEVLATKEQESIGNMTSKAARRSTTSHVSEASSTATASQADITPSSETEAIAGESGAKEVMSLALTGDETASVNAIISQEQLPLTPASAKVPSYEDDHPTAAGSDIKFTPTSQAAGIDMAISQAELVAVLDPGDIDPAVLTMRVNSLISTVDKDLNLDGAVDMCSQQYPPNQLATLQKSAPKACHKLNKLLGMRKQEIFVSCVDAVKITYRMMNLHTAFTLNQPNRFGTPSDETIFKAIMILTREKLATVTERHDKTVRAQEQLERLFSLNHCTFAH